MMQLLKVLSSYRFRFSSEKELQEGISVALERNSVEFIREKSLSAKDRIDFFIPETGIGIEVKLDGSANKLARQVQKYSEYPDLKGLLVVVTRSRLTDLPEQLNGKPIVVFKVSNL